MIKISVIVPVYKVPLDFLKECFDSLLAQTMQECEFIIVSDGAPEPECSVCKDYAQKDSRFRTFFNNHAGVSSARNFGIKQARGEFITFVDSDDWIDCENLEKIYDVAKKETCDIVFWDLCFFQGHNEILDMTSFEYSKKVLLDCSDKQRYQKNIIWASEKKKLIPALTVCKLISKKIIEHHNIFFDEHLTFGEDRVFNYRISKVANHIVYYPMAFYHYRQHEKSTMNIFQERSFQKHFQYITALENISEGKHQEAIANETIYSFYSCLMKLYQQNVTKEIFFKELYFLKEQSKRPTFIRLIQACNVDFNDFQRKIEIYLMKKGCPLFFLLRIIKFKLFH